MSALLELDAGEARQSLTHRARGHAVLLIEQIGFGILLVGAWQLVSTRHWINSAAMSSPSAVWDYLSNALTTRLMWTNLSATLEATMLAFALASVAGVVIGVSLALLPRIERVVAPYIDAMNAMPRIALAPVFVIMFGITLSAKVALGVSIVVFIVLSAARAGVRSVDIDITVLARVLGASKPQLFFKVLLPVAVPSIFAGLRLGLIYSLLGVVTSELIASRDGLGQLIQTYASNFDIAAVYGILIILAVIAVAMNAIMGAAERWLLRWRPEAHAA